MLTSAIEIRGFCDRKFDLVREAFVTNFRDHDEMGASVSVISGGKSVVDLWAGWRDIAGTKPWQRDTIVNFWSSTD